MLSENLKSLIEAIVEQEFRAALRGTRDLRKALTGPHKLQGAAPKGDAPEGEYGSATAMTGAQKGRFDLQNPRMAQDKRTAIAKIKK